MKLIALVIIVSFLSFPAIGSDLPFQPRGGAKAGTDLWEDGVLPLVFEDGISEKKRRLLFEACAQWSAVANVRCVEGPYKNRKLRVTENLGNGCWASWGMSAHFLVVARRMNLSKGCWNPGTLLHELGHSFGFIHEHQRPDRDEYITIVRENVAGGFLGMNTSTNFDIQKAQLESGYDFLSIMHYSRDAASKNGRDTIVPHEPYMKYIDVMGETDTLSDGDIRTIRAMYGQRISE